MNGLSAIFATTTPVTRSEASRCLPRGSAGRQSCSKASPTSIWLCFWYARPDRGRGRACRLPLGGLKLASRSRGFCKRRDMESRRRSHEPAIGARRRAKQETRRAVKSVWELCRTAQGCDAADAGRIAAPIACRVMRVHFGDRTAEMHHEHSDTPAIGQGLCLPRGHPGPGHPPGHGVAIVQYHELGFLY